jgi:hypothetical protein
MMVRQANFNKFLDDVLGFADWKVKSFQNIDVLRFLIGQNNCDCLSTNPLLRQIHSAFIRIV